MEDEKRRVLLDELIRYTTPAEPPPDTFSTCEYVERCAELGEAISMRVGLERLKKGMGEGAVEGEKVDRVWQWRLVTPDILEAGDD